MRLLLDTHALLWIMMDDERLSAGARSAYASKRNDILLSVVSLWELSIKASLGKLEVDGGLRQRVERHLRENGITLIDVAAAHAWSVEHLPFHHRDPFDRLIAGTCLSEGFALISRDAAFDASGVTRVW